MKLFYSQKETLIIQHKLEIRILKKEHLVIKGIIFTHTMDMKIFFIVAQVVFHVEV
jgi:hypothetical protein